MYYLEQSGAQVLSCGSLPVNQERQFQQWILNIKMRVIKHACHEMVELKLTKHACHERVEPCEIKHAMVPGKEQRLHPLYLVQTLIYGRLHMP